MKKHARIEEFDSKQRIGKRTTVGVLLETVFSIRSIQNCYKCDDTSIVALRAVGGDENGSLESETVKCGRESQGTRTRE
jgi:hypothetical protein